MYPSRWLFVGGYCAVGRGLVPADAPAGRQRFHLIIVGLTAAPADPASMLFTLPAIGKPAAQPPLAPPLGELAFARYEQMTEGVPLRTIRHSPSLLPC